MSPGRRPVHLPELELPGVTIRSSCWHTRRGGRVIQGDRLLEVVAGDVVVDIAAPASGVLVQKCVAEHEVLRVGQLLGWIAPD